MRRVLGIVLVVLGLVAGPPGGAETPATLSFADGQDVTSLNPLFASSGNILPLGELTSALFTRVDPHGRPVPELVTEIPTKANHGVSADGRTIIWHLRPHLKWSDGQPLDAGDVVYSYRVGMDPSNDVYVRDSWEKLAGVVAPDPTTVVFHFKRPYALFATDYFSSVSNNAILPRHVLGPGTSIGQAPFNGLPIGAGPFRYVAYRRGDAVEMEANPYYWRGLPHLPRITYKIVIADSTIYTQLRTGEVDLWDIVNGLYAQQLRALPNVTVHSRLSNYLEVLALNTRRPIVSDPGVRRALELATDRPLILRKTALGNGELTQSVIARTSVDRLDLPLVPFDLERAAKLLDRDGWRLGADGVRHRGPARLSLEVALPAGNEPRALEANVLHDDWAKIGIETHIHLYANGQYFGPSDAGGIIQTGRFDVALFADDGGQLNANTDGRLSCGSIPPAGANATGFCSRALDALNARYLSSFDSRERRSLAASMQRLIDRATPFIVLYERDFVAGADARVTGYAPNSYSYWGDPFRLAVR